MHHMIFNLFPSTMFFGVWKNYYFVSLLLFILTDWQGPSPENRMFSPSWGFESTISFSQQFQLPIATGNAHTVHHYTFPQNWHHPVTPQSFK